MSPSDRFYSILKKVLSIFETILLAVTKAWLNTQIGQGFLRKVVGWMVDKLYDESLKPFLDVLLVRIGYRYDVKEGQILIQRLRDAKESGNVEDYNSTVDDILS